MKVKVGDVVYESTKDQPIMVILTDQDKKNITAMHPEATRYAIFSDESGGKYPDKKSQFAWMKANNDES